MYPSTTINKCAALAILCALLVQVCETAPSQTMPCGGKPADVVFVLDASASMWGPNFRRQLQFVRDVTSEFDVSARRTRVGVFTFGSRVREEIPLNRFISHDFLLDSIVSIPQLHGNTRTDSALSRAFLTLQKHRRPEVPQLVIVLTDGESDKPVLTRDMARTLHDADVIMFVVGIGDQVNVNELQAIASRPEYVFEVDTFNALEALRETLAIKACKVEFVPKGTPTPPTKGCGGKPADIVFALDASGSIWEPDFERQLQFVKDIVGVFDISPKATRIGMLTYGDDPMDQFELGDFSTVEEIQEAVGHVTQQRGETFTNAAIHHMLHHHFSAKRARPNVAKIGIIITDGMSNRPGATERQAELAREAGVHLFAVGVGHNVQLNELFSIASHPQESYLFQVDNYATLDSIKELLAMQACKVTDPPTTPTIPTTTTTTAPSTTLPQDEEPCGPNAPADVMFAMPPMASAPDTTRMIHWMKNLVQEFRVDGEQLRMGLAPKDCMAVPGFHLRDSSSKEATLAKFQGHRYAAADTTTVIKYFRNDGFRDAREGSKKIGVVIVDQNSASQSSTAFESWQARARDGVQLLVIAVGKDVSDMEKRAIASSTNIIDVPDYSSLADITPTLISRINDACAGTRH